MKSSRRRLAAFTFAAVLGVLACSSSSTTDDSGGSGSTGGCCTVNGKSYRCNDDTTFANCSGSKSDPTGCSAVSSCTNDKTSSSAFCCAVNEAFFDCPSLAALEECAKGKNATCTPRASECSH